MAPNGVNAGDRETRIRKRAYEIWEAEGRPNGREREHWERATGEVTRTPNPTAAAKGARQPKTRAKGNPAPRTSPTGNAHRV